MIGRRLWIVLGTIMTLWFAWALQYFIFQLFGWHWESTQLGTWGDSFGALNALFAAFACFGVIATLRMQSHELRQQSDQLHHQQKEIKRTERQREIERFEGHFFQLLSLLRQLKSEIVYTQPGIHNETKKGHEAVRQANDDLQRYLLPRFGNENDISETQISDTYSDAIHRLSEDTLGPYFRIVYSILRKTYENSSLSDNEKAGYGNILRSQLSSPEVQLISANALTLASNDFRKYVIEFRLLKYLPAGYYRDALEKIYPEEAFSPRD